MAYAEEEYYRAQGTDNGNRNRVLPLSGKSNSQPQPQLAGASQVETQEAKIDALAKKLEDLRNILQTMTVRKQRSKYCAYCRVVDHNLAECPYNPPRGVCFDCHRPNCRRGHDGCPGPQNGNVNAD